ncbi:MAG TPA: condensation domain-containing protein, partial [Polyangiaceae bacterium]|nr:condensation domain-containing protein [Polyangiaceae bacterium]
MPNFTRVDHDPFEHGELVSAFNTTASQKEIWLGAWFGGSDANRAFNECVILQLNGALNRRAFAAAYEQLVARHDALMMTFSADGEWCIVGRTPDTRLSNANLSALNESDQAAEIVRLRVAEVTQGFDLTQGPLHRATMISLRAQQHLFLFSAHHIVCDWWSAGVLLQDLAALYRRE